MSVRVDQALISAFVAGNFDLPIAHENALFEEDKSTAYVALTVFQNEDRPFDLAHINSQTGALQCVLRYPLQSGAIQAKQKLSEIFDYFKIGRRFQFEGQAVQIRSLQRFSNRQEDGMYHVTGRINYVAYLPR